MGSPGGLKVPKPVLFADFNKLRLPDTSLVEGGILHERSRLLIAGSSGIGKSYLALQLAWESALGLPWFGLWRLRRPMRTLVIQLEVTERVYQERTQRLALAERKVPGLWLETRETYSLIRDEKETTAKCEELGINLLVLDPLYLMSEGDENAVHTIKPTQEVIDRHRGRGLTIMAVHHIRKPAPGERLTLASVRGSSAWTYWVDSVFLAAPGPNDTVRVALAKARARQEKLPPSLVLGWRPQGRFFEVEAEADNEMALIQELLQKGPVEKEKFLKLLQKALGKSQATAYRRLGNAVEGGLVAERDGVVLLA